MNMKAQEAAGLAGLYIDDDVDSLDSPDAIKVVNECVSEMQDRGVYFEGQMTGEYSADTGYSIIATGETAAALWTKVRQVLLPNNKMKEYNRWKIIGDQIYFNEPGHYLVIFDRMPKKIVAITDTLDGPDYFNICYITYIKYWMRAQQDEGEGVEGPQLLAQFYSELDSAKKIYAKRKASPLTQIRTAVRRR
jgi:hypothetical protein